MLGWQYVRMILRRMWVALAPSLAAAVGAVTGLSDPSSACTSAVQIRNALSARQMKRCRHPAGTDRRPEQIGRRARGSTERQQPGPRSVADSETPNCQYESKGCLIGEWVWDHSTTNSISITARYSGLFFGGRLGGQADRAGPKYSPAPDLSGPSGAPTATAARCSTVGCQPR